MSKVIVNDAMKELLRKATADAPIEVCDEHGVFLGIFSRPISHRGRVPGMTAKDMEALFTEEELNRKPDEPPSTRTLESVLREIGG